jgi:hypothetical protein
MFKDLFKVDKLMVGSLALYIGSSVVQGVIKSREETRARQKKSLLTARDAAQKIVDDLTKERDKVAQQIKDRDAKQPAKTIADLSDQEWADLWDKL